VDPRDNPVSDPKTSPVWFEYLLNNKYGMQKLAMFLKRSKALDKEQDMNTPARSENQRPGQRDRMESMRNRQTTHH